MIWPFISRERYQERTAELDRLRAELEKERAEHKQLQNWLTWRLGGIAPDPGLLPEEYRRKQIAASPAKDEDATPSRLRRPVRQELSLFEVRREAEFERLRGVPEPQPSVAVSSAVEGQVEMLERMSGIVQEVTQTKTGG